MKDIIIILEIVIKNYCIIFIHLEIIFKRQVVSILDSKKLIALEHLSKHIKLQFTVLHISI